MVLESTSSSESLLYTVSSLSLSLSLPDVFPLKKTKSAPITLALLGAGTAGYAAQRNDSIGAVARKGGRGVHKVARVNGKTLDAGLQCQKVR